MDQKLVEKVLALELGKATDELLDETINHVEEQLGVKIDREAVRQRMREQGKLR